MKTNLSSKIKLDSIPPRYYNPVDEVELAALTREEKIDTKIYETLQEGSEGIAEHVIHALQRAEAKRGKFVMAIGAGNNVRSVVSALVEAHKAGKVSFKNTIVFNLCDFYSDGKANATSTVNNLKENFIDQIDLPAENFHTFNISVSKENVGEMCRDYEAQIENAGGLDLVLCQVGPQGAIGLNEPGSTASSVCRLVLLSAEQRQNIGSSYGVEHTPTTGVTLGMSNILSSRRIISMAWGENRAEIVEKAVEGPATPNVPASLLQGHSRVTLVLDINAAENLTRISRPWLVTNCEWNDKLIRRAIVWLCLQTGKPILKLTNQDYNDHGLGELLAIYGSGYNVNIKVFNELQHTITGWPGGKPGADDTYRPERANPYPKRVIIFSPHPDDDVISMGGTFKRLVDQGHDVHVAYETSGNIAVGDEDMMRYIMLNDYIAPIFGFDNDNFKQKSKEINEFVANKKAGEKDSDDIRTIKTMIRQAEARTACKYIGVKPENVHFLRLPFYETGAIKKGDLTEKDIEIVRDLILSVKPHEIFVAGDLADPHGTHRVCTDAVFAVIDECKDDEWMKDCRIWMYRGAWAEWEIDHIEMAVPISPEELRFKRNSILKHQSQMENAPFLGDDDRLFWQRAEERNRATAQLYEQLGLASYEAMEAFVQYHPIRED
ncbi:MAG: glucosamine-6-phosphate deaminase [Bacteroidales bacterium]|nr:glucosamine-6-phosphate deaminase [Bacteroidales bacterium]MBD5282385.1 glucosamine-6-phosphate deaminase [Bacteroides sp.]MBD5294476.1 glucosamine-6-phosphate deaminase [Bacteroides sp.]MBD5343207.1 glucosamine-6-phosphate deaminase [Bacteroides sp.]MBD5360829.1 glucosamine-6-phosphate deaminase [Bacteroides sp.]